jgi:dihydrofolate reductase
MKATLYVASSLNGLMTEGKTNSSWVSEHDEIMFAKTCSEIGCILVGRQTFDQYQGVVYPVPDTVNVVLTSENRTSDNENVIYKNDFDTAVQKIKDLGFERFIVVGGAHVIAQCLEQQLVDRVLLSLHPYIFGDGLSIIGNYQSNIDLKFEGIKHQHNEFVLLDYSVSEYKKENQK